MPPTEIVVVDLFRLTPVTFITAGDTVIVHDAVKPPSAVVTVIVAIPAATAVTNPLEDTIALLPSEVLHVTFWFVAFAGAMVAVSCSVPPTEIVVVDLFRLTPVTFITAGDTVIVHDAVKPPSAVVTVIVADPAETPVTSPLAFTVAFAESLLVHIRVWLVAPVGAIVAVSCSVPPTATDVDVLLRVTPITVIVVSVVPGLLIELLPAPVLQAIAINIIEKPKSIINKILLMDFLEFCFKFQKRVIYFPPEKV
jgi:hypothetical protein